MQTFDTDLTGLCLIATPAMGDARFERALIYLCAHSEDGTMGLIVNKPTPEVRFSDLLDQLEIPMGPAPQDIRVHFGGPVEMSRGFVLHTDDYRTEAATLEVRDGVGMTTTLEVLEDLARGEGPRASMLALGYAGWGPGQLEQEIAENAWLTCPASRTLLFGRAAEHKWTAAMKSIGVDPLLLSDTAGHA